MIIKIIKPDVKELDKKAMFPSIGGTLLILGVLGPTLYRIVTKTYEQILIGVQIWRLQLAITLTMAR